MSIWQFHAVLDGYAKSHTGGKDKLTEAEKDDLFGWVDAANSNERVLSTMTWWFDGRDFLPHGRVTFTVH